MGQGAGDRANEIGGRTCLDCNLHVDPGFKSQIAAQVDTHGTRSPCYQFAASHGVDAADCIQEVPEKPDGRTLLVIVAVDHHLTVVVLSIFVRVSRHCSSPVLIPWRHHAAVDGSDMSSGREFNVNSNVNNL